jgi:hypothetical protein
MKATSIAAGLGIAAIIGLSGCAATNFLGAVGQAAEYQKKIEVLAKYSGLENKTVAVLVDADLATLYDYPDLAATVTSGVTARLGRDVPGAKVLNPQIVVTWQYRTPLWNSLPYGEICEQLNVDRVVFIDIQEFRLNPPGNRWEWEGAASAMVGIIERDGIDPDQFAQTIDLSARFPTVSGVDRDSASANQIKTGLLAEFIKKTSWLFHTHIEPKYPDKYRPELDRK